MEESFRKSLRLCLDPPPKKEDLFLWPLLSPDFVLLTLPGDRSGEDEELGDCDDGDRRRCFFMRDIHTIVTVVLKATKGKEEECKTTRGERAVG